MSEQIDRERLIKLLNLTRSDSDGEALLAARRANDHLDKCGSSWEIALTPGDRIIQIPASRPTTQASMDSEERMSPEDFERVQRHCEWVLSVSTNLKRREWAENLLTFAKRHGRLSEKQEKTLSNVVEAELAEQEERNEKGDS